ncbi:MAG: hypothetical protein EOO46_10425 [Flavobacterium sp.]|nr:MAG: hypothetical protein EOO46_10425 [Flavobacterium sp.]
MSDYIRSNQVDYIISFKKSNGKFRVYSSATDEITTMPLLPPGNAKLRKFIMLKQSERDDNQPTDECLERYAKRFKNWCKELNDSHLRINYANYYSDYTAVTCTFNRWSKKNYANHAPISATEYMWFEKCANFGIQYLKEKDITTKVWSYDFKNQYGLILSGDTLIPTKEGEETTLKKLPSRRHLKPGFYHVKITCDNDNFRKIFAFSKHNVYVKESLKFAMKHADEYDVSIELIMDDKPNAYLYDDKDMVTMSSITSEWFTNLTDLRSKLKGNKLIKHLISSAWGHLNADNKLYKTWEEIEEEKLDIGYEDGHDYKILEYQDYGDRECFVLLNTKNPYKHHIRLKPWVTAVARNLTASIVLQDIKRVVRVHTDCVSFTREQEFDDPNLVEEEKTTGKIHWKHCNSYHNITTGYKTQKYD